MNTVVQVAPEYAGMLLEHVARHHAENTAGGSLFMAPTDLAAFASSYTPESWDWSPIMVGWQRVWCVFDASGIVGNAVLTGYPHPLCGHRCTLGIGVESAARAQGAGRALTRAALRWAVEQEPLRWVDGVALASNQPVLRLFYSVGFRRVGEYHDTFRFGGRSYDQVLLALDLRDVKGV